MPEILVSFAGTIYIEGLKSGDNVEIENNITISAFLLSKGLAPHHLKLVIPVVNGEEQPLDYILKNNDKLNLFMPVGGG